MKKGCLGSRRNSSMFINLKAKSQIVWEKLKIQGRKKIIYVQDSRVM